jgi:BirA family transcriptional regulator, biotin operon repressor / biotin---[acetyl-CoA-carboxylase] ligase
VGMTAGTPGADLSTEAIAEVLPDRPVRSYPAILSTQADALAWARADAPDGALVVADYQASPRGRAGLPWEVRPGEGIGFSLIVRPRLPGHREGWPYLPATCGLADAHGTEARVHWPDEVRGPEGRIAAVGVDTDVGALGVRWAVITTLVDDARPPRAPHLADVVHAIEERMTAPPEEVLDALRQRCVTLGRQVTALLIPMGPSGPEVAGRAVDLRDDGALVVERSDGRRVVVPPQNLGRLEETT